MKSVFELIWKYSGAAFLERHRVVHMVFVVVVFGIILFFLAWGSFSNFSKEPVKIIYHCGSMEETSENTFSDWNSCNAVQKTGCACTRVDGPFKFLNKISNVFYSDS